MQTKKRSDDACVKRATLKTGWCGWGSLFRASIPKTAASDAPRIVSSKVTGIKAGQLLSGRPPMFRREGIADAQNCKIKPPTPPVKPPRRQITGTMLDL